MDALLQIEGLSKNYGSVKALQDTTLSLPAGRIVGLLGPNGSGKTTLIKLIAGLMTPSSGTILIDGKPIGPETKAIVSYLPDRIYFNENQRVSDLILLYKDFYADFDEQTAQTILGDLNINIKKKFNTLSKGTKEKVQLALVMSRRAKLYLLDEPIAGVDRAKLYLLDEPIAGVDPAARDYILTTIISNYHRDATILISTHLISDVEQVLDDYLFLHNGHIIQQGSAKEQKEATGQTLDELFREVFRCLPSC